MFCQHLPGRFSAGEPCGRSPRSRSLHVPVRSRAAGVPRLPGADWRQLMTRIVMVVLLILGLGIAAPAGQEGPRRTTPAAKASTSGPLDLNTATVAQLDSLPGIGKSTAKLILEYRDKSGGFKKVEEILETSRSCPYSLSVFDLGSLP